MQRVIASLDGRPEITLAPAALAPVALAEVMPAELAHGEAGPFRLARMTSWLDGDPLGKETVGHGLRTEIGATLARLSMALRRVQPPGRAADPLVGPAAAGQAPAAAGRPAARTACCPRSARRWRWPGATAGRDARRERDGAGGAGAGGLKGALGDYLDRFDAVVRPRLARVPVQVIHTDFHGLNLLGDGQRITGILDFGDALTGPVAMDVAVAACYQLGSGADPLAPALDVVAGYHAIDPLERADAELAAEFIVARVVARIIVSQWNALREPANRGYLLRRTPEAIEHYNALRRVGDGEIAARLRAACWTSEGPVTEPAPVMVNAFDGSHAADLPPATRDLVRRREAALGGAYRLFYASPVELARGSGVYLYDPAGEAYLDAYNNVPSVGHSHPHVTEAVTGSWARSTRTPGT